MRIEIDIPREFEEHFKQDKFKDSLERIMADIWHSLEIGNCLCAGNYEYETIEMLLDLYHQGRADAIDDFANWLVEQGILGNRCISDGEITDYGRVYAKKYKEQLKEGDKE